MTVNSLGGLRRLSKCLLNGDTYAAVILFVQFIVQRQTDRQYTPVSRLRCWRAEEMERYVPKREYVGRGNDTQCQHDGCPQRLARIFKVVYYQTANLASSFKARD
ncbi:hypothetical protein BDDG_03424 [Blastomyces dermatitidis ATCC 18188]|uniref:Uncharacterized protein n=1 Tax=Ajellomyces dermatitidis (strain ATCC 18188 / CBS 674.68) TaxID=653446 RepID=F2TB70_AJEDA|nr:hypothetical protein BDDG_03424 [Blastomyces dermatitidis ATCC 18188]